MSRNHLFVQSLSPSIWRRYSNRLWRQLHGNASAGTVNSMTDSWFDVKDQWERFRRYLNSLHPNIRFLMEMKEDSLPPYVHVRVNRKVEVLILVLRVVFSTPLRRPKPFVTKELQKSCLWRALSGRMGTVQGTFVATWTLDSSRFYTRISKTYPQNASDRISRFLGRSKVRSKHVPKKAIFLETSDNWLCSSARTQGSCFRIPVEGWMSVCVYSVLFCV
jgi:hypothetical protein